MKYILTGISCLCILVRISAMDLFREESMYSWRSAIWLSTRSWSLHTCCINTPWNQRHQTHSRPGSFSIMCMGRHWMPRWLQSSCSVTVNLQKRCNICNLRIRDCQMSKTSTNWDCVLKPFWQVWIIIKWNHYFNIFDTSFLYMYKAVDTCTCNFAMTCPNIAKKHKLLIKNVHNIKVWSFIFC